MIFAGGALAATACSGSTTSMADPDPASGSTSDAASDRTVSFGCCNGSADPCCFMTCTDGLLPSSYDECEQGRAQCEAMTGSFVYGPDASSHCAPGVPVEPSPPDAGTEGERAADASLSDAGARDGDALDAGPVDASDDVPSVLFCCNANPDPCCPIAYCGGVGPDGSIYLTCEQNRAQCEAMNGFYRTQADGSLGCTPMSTTGH